MTKDLCMVQDLRFSQWWRFKSSGLWHHIVLWLDTSISENHTAFIFRVKMEAAWSIFPLKMEADF